MAKVVTENFYKFVMPEYDGVSERMLKGVKESYGIEVLETVTTMAKEYKDEVFKLVTVSCGRTSCTHR